LRSAGVLVAVVIAAGCASEGARAPVVERSASRAAAPRAVAKPPPAAAAASVVAPAAQDGFYVVKRGDTLYSIALDSGADYRELAQWNGLGDPTRIQVGQTLRVKPPEVRGVQIGRPASAGPIESHPLDAAPSAAAAKAPSKPLAAEAKATALAPAAPGAVEFIWPVKGKVIAGFAEPRSKGIDIDGKLGDPVVAAAPGRVTYIGSGIPGLGKLVVIKHDNGFITVYAHNRDIVVKEQQNVARGQKIAELGASDSDRPKLHFQIRKGASAVDPLRYLPAL
jgi:lipoprotein NlpD